jgi:hypothetical protein
MKPQLILFFTRDRTFAKSVLQNRHNEEIAEIEGRNTYQPELVMVACVRCVARHNCGGAVPGFEAGENRERELRSRISIALDAKGHASRVSECVRIRRGHAADKCDQGNVSAGHARAHDKEDFSVIYKYLSNDSDFATPDGEWVDNGKLPHRTDERRFTNQRC